MLRNVSYVRIEDMDPEQRQKLGITEDMGLVAIETHNTEYELKAVLINEGITDYILND